MYGSESTAKDQRSVWSKKHTSPTAKPAATAVTAAFVVLFVHNSPTNIVAPIGTDKPVVNRAVTGQVRKAKYNRQAAVGRRWPVVRALAGNPEKAGGP